MPQNCCIILDGHRTAKAINMAFISTVEVLNWRRDDASSESGLVDLYHVKDGKLVLLGPSNPNMIF